MRAARLRAPRGNLALGVSGTVLVHGAAIVLLVALAPRVRIAPPVYAVNLVAAPAPAPESPKPTVTQPSPPPPPVAPTKVTKSTRPVPPAPKPVPKPPPSTTEAPAHKAPPPPTTAAPGETPSTGTDAVTVKTPGLDFPFPDYLRNIVSQVYRRWDRPSGGSGLRAEVFFLITRDGTVKDIRFVTSSGNFAFDLGAQGAVEAAGNTHAFGPLPDGYGQDVLPVSFYFVPGMAR
ncbi:MAG TPA: energy transducer TonB [Gemmatimonadales bacterium]|nr:energy transducer TonB [Gemmatimonadales bacterium]